jgi:hypothetical protein
VYFLQKSAAVFETFRFYMESCTGKNHNSSTGDVSTGRAHSCGVHNSMGLWPNLVIIRSKER